MPTPTTTRHWVLNRQIVGEPILKGSHATFRLETVDLPRLGDGQVLIRNKYISNDPGQRFWISSSISADRSYTLPVHAGETMRCNSIAEIVESRVPSLPKGALVNTFMAGWSEYAVLDASDVQLLSDIPGISPTHFLGALGITGLTAYYGTKIITEAKAEDVLVVSGAAGATGSMVVQIAKHLVTCKTVIGIAGSEEKCDWVKRLGADICLNYKSPTFREDLIAATPGLVDIFFDNVGGDILDIMLSRMRCKGRIAVCGAISSYNKSSGFQLNNWLDVIAMRLHLRGFIVSDWIESGKASEAIQEIAKAAQEGKIKINSETETLINADIEDVPGVWVRLFNGSNSGKLVTEIQWH